MYTPVFQSIPNDWRGRWQLIRTFLARVYHLDLPRSNRTTRPIKKLESQLDGKRIPPSVSEWMRFAQDLRKDPRTATDYSHYNLQTAPFPEHDSLALNRFYENMQWAVAYADFTQEDPPVRAYGFVQGKNRWQLRKSYGQAPVTHYAMHVALNYSPWFGGWTSYSLMGSSLDEPAAFIKELRATRGAQVSDPFGSLTFVEGTGWLAYIVNGYSPFGPQNFLKLQFSQGTRLTDIPKPIRRLVGMKPSHLRRPWAD